MEIVKKTYLICLSFLLLVCFASCGQTNKSIYTVEKLQLSNDEQLIASLTSDIVEKFVFEKNKIYDIQGYFYHNGTLENFGGAYGVDTIGQDKIILISGRRDENVGFAWGISASGVSKYPAIEIDDDRTFMMVNGTGREQFVMEEGKEYVLVFAAFKEGMQLESSFVEPFYMWDTVEDKAEALKEFSYAYIITVRLSDIPVEGTKS